MMDHEQFRRVVLANPLTTDPEIEAHRAQCEDCRAFSERLITFEQRLVSALKVTAPTRAKILSFDTRVAVGLAGERRWRASHLAGKATIPAILRQVSDEQALGVVGFIREYMARAAREGNGARPSAVYKRAGQPCLRCSAPVRARGQGENNRITYWCPGCQL